jgi:hypothetical protein
LWPTGNNLSMHETRVIDDGDAAAPVAEVGIAVGGALAVLASFLRWASVSVGLPAGLGAGAGIGQGAQGRLGGRLGRGILGRLFPNGLLSRSVSGIRTSDGRLVLGLGIALLVVAALSFLSRWNLQRAAAGAVAAALGAVTLAVPVATTATPADTGLPAAVSRLLSFQVSTGPGVYVAIVAGAVAVVAGAWALLSARPPAPLVVTSGPVPPPPATAAETTTAPTEVVPPVAPES